jgi:phenylacetic acid degradation operon negative regulatory protein
MVMKRLTAKSLILDLLLAAAPSELSARDAITACALFDISENNARVALVRLSAAGLVEGVGRGAYRLGHDARDLAAEVSTWRRAERRIRAWDGDYVVVGTHTLDGSDRTAVRNRTRALSMLGFRELTRGLQVRPNNLDDSIEITRERLRVLGMPEGALVFVGRDFDEKQARAIRALWDGRALSKAYRTLTDELTGWLERASTLEHDVPARESFLLGGRGIKHVVLDPLLPDSYVDAEARHTFFETVKRFDEAGREIWRRFFTSTNVPALAQSEGLTH